MPPALLLVLLLSAAAADCPPRLPVAGTTTTRVVSGIRSPPSDFDNVVTFAADSDEGPDYSCVGSLVAPEWVLTAAQCFVLPGGFVRRGSTSLSGSSYPITAVFDHPGSITAGGPVQRDDIKLVRLGTPIPGTVVRPTPPPAADGAEGDGEDEGAEAPESPTIPGAQEEELPAVNKDFNFMFVNNNTDFAMDGPRYLRVKGFGIITQPNEATEPLRFRERFLRFADLRTAACDDSFGNDGGRRLCTRRDDSCGACYGDTGAPLYDVDASGTFSVLVGIVTFGKVSTSFEDPVCTGERPVVYTAVAHYAAWVKQKILNETGEDRAFFFDLPKEGITDTDLERDTSTLAIFATTSVIVVSCLALLGTLATIIITCVVRHYRKKRKRWIEGLQAEESFVKAGEKDAIIVDPFEGIQNDQHPRFSFSGFSRAAVKGATDFSTRSIGVIKAFVAKDRDEDFFEPREIMDDAPVWVPTAWDRLFMAPSKKDLDRIHKIPTQRVVDDVLTGADKSVEPSLEEVRYRSKRDEANLEAAWAKLEIQTSLRNLSDASGSTAQLVSPPLSPRVHGSPRKGSRNSSRAMSPLGSGMGKQLDVTKTDTLFAAFAAIDAESEQVAEETTIDSSALRALAEAKRPNVLSVLRRKFSSGPSSPSLQSPSAQAQDRGSEGGGTPRIGSGGVRADAATSPEYDSRGTGRVVQSGIRLPSGRSSRVATVLSSNSGVLTKGSLGSRHSSMVMDYFSEEYNLSSESSDDDEEQVTFEDMFDSKNRRFTEDRKPLSEHESRSMLSSRSMRKRQNRSFESLEDICIPAEMRFGDRSKMESFVSAARSEVQVNLPMSSSSVSSDKRPRSSAAGHSGAGPSSQTGSRAGGAVPGAERLSVEMEDEAHAAKQSARVDGTEHMDQDAVSVYMEMESEAGAAKGSKAGSRTFPCRGGDTLGGRYASQDRAKRKGADAESAAAAGRTRPVSEDMTHRTPFFAGEAVSVHMEDEAGSAGSVRARVHAFDESDKRARRVSESSAGGARQRSDVSVARLKHMWNEIARRQSEEGGGGR